VWLKSAKGENVSSKSFEELVERFHSLPPDEHKAFIAIVKASAQAQLFNRNDPGEGEK
jgi:hypothetical protein